jgi:hypothetical protein
MDEICGLSHEGKNIKVLKIRVLRTMFECNREEITHRLEKKKS